MKTHEIQDKGTTLGNRTDLQGGEQMFYEANRLNDETSLLRKLFLNYLSKGETALELKSALLSRGEGRGGCMIPLTVQEGIDQQLRQLCPLRSLAHLRQTHSDSIEILVDRTFAEAGWVQGDQAETPSPSEFEKIRIDAHQLFVRPMATQALLDDSGDHLERWFTHKIAQKMAVAENKAFLYGDGLTQPKGILTYPFVPLGQGKWGSFESVQSSHQGLDDLRDHLFTLVSSLKAEYHPRAAWLISRSALTILQKITDPLGHFLWQPSLALGTPPVLLGYPVFVCDDMPLWEIPSDPSQPMSHEEGSKAFPETKVEAAQRASIPIVFGDFEATYCIVDRSEISVLRDPFSVKPYVEFFASKRVGGDVINFESLKGLQLSKE